MLPVSSWPPGPPGASLSPFGKPREINLCRHPHGFVIPTGAWIVRTGTNRVVMFTPPVVPNNPPRTPGTGYLPGQIAPCPPLPPCPPPCPPRRKSVWIGPGTVNIANGTTATVQMSLSKQTPPTPPTPPPCPPVEPRRFHKYNDVVEAFRAWQRRTGNTDPPLRPLAGRRPPNWFGWRFVRAPGSTLVPPCASGLVIADGQNVVIAGGGFATITQAYSV